MKGFGSCNSTIFDCREFQWLIPKIMAGKRKRRARAPPDTSEVPEKRQKVTHNSDPVNNVVRQALLSQFYPQVVSLREYLLLKLPKSSKVRRKKIKSATKHDHDGGADFARFLDETLVGIARDTSSSLTSHRWAQWTTFSQRVDESASTLHNLSGVGKFSQSEVRKPLFRDNAKTI